MFAVRFVPRGQSHTVHRRGRFLRSLQPGLHFIVPLIDQVSHKVDMKGRALTLHCEQLASKDECPVIADGVLYFQILDARKAAERLTTLDDAARNLAETSTREMVGQMTFTSLTSHSGPEINSWLLGMVNQSAVPWGVRATRIELDFKQGLQRRTTGDLPIVSNDEEPPPEG